MARYEEHRSCDFCSFDTTDPDFVLHRSDNGTDGEEDYCTFCYHTLNVSRRDPVLMHINHMLNLMERK